MGQEWSNLRSEVSICECSKKKKVWRVGLQGGTGDAGVVVRFSFSRESNNGAFMIFEMELHAEQ